MPKKALVIDDEPGVREILRYFLESHGWDVETASTGEEGLGAFTAHGPSLVMVDGTMPGMNGFETARRLCERAAAPPTIVMLTGDGAPQPSPATLAESGINHYMTKPFDDLELSELLDRIATEGGPTA